VSVSGPDPAKVTVDDPHIAMRLADALVGLRRSTGTARAIATGNRSHPRDDDISRPVWLEVAKDIFNFCREKNANVNAVRAANRSC
jgi:hypothetical protein